MKKLAHDASKFHASQNLKASGSQGAQIASQLVWLRVAVLVSLSCFWGSAIEAQSVLGTEFTYQGQLEQNGSPANGVFDFEFNVYDGSDPVTATLVGTTTLFDVGVTDGLFVVLLDFGDIWGGEERWLELRVREAAVGTFVALAPAQKMTPSPYALFAANAGDAAQLGGVDASNFLQTSGGDLAIPGTLQTGDGGVTVPYNRHGTAASSHGMATAQDLLVSDDLEVVDNLYVDTAIVDGNIELAGSLLFDGIAERLEWDSAQSRFELSNELAIQNVIRVGTRGATPVPYSVFGGTADPSSGDMNNDSDVFIRDDLEIGSQLYLSGELRMDTEEGDQRIYFFDSGSPIGEELLWDDSETRLEWSDDFAVAGALQTGSQTGAVAYNRFGASVPVSGHISTVNDVLVSDDLEVIDDVEAGGDLDVGLDLDVGRDIWVGSASDSNSDTIYFDRSERLEWDEPQSRFEFSDELAVLNVIRVGTLGSAPVPYSAFGNSSDTISGDMGDDGDVFIENDVEIGEELYLNGELRMGLEEGDQSIYFFDEGSQTRNRFYWSDQFDKFFLTDTLDVDGTLIANIKNFKIDHPLDPAGMYLYHTSVESPDMMTVYSGNVVTDAHGEAVVELPRYFEALNRNYRYQLTCIGAFAQAIVAEEIQDNSFVVMTDEPYVKVSWQVTGVRQDKWANENRVVPEVMKPPYEKGTFLHK